MKKRITNCVVLLAFLLIVFLNALILPKNKSENIDKSGILLSEETTEEATVVTREEAMIEMAINQMNEEMAIIDNIENKEKWFKEYKEIVDKYSYILDPPETIYDYFDEDELDLLFRVVHAEIGDEWDFEEKVNVANVIFNRLSNEVFPDTIFEVLTEDQFCTIRNGSYLNEPSEKTITACEYAFMFPDTTNGALFFDNNGVLEKSYKKVYEDKAHNFYSLKTV